MNRDKLAGRALVVLLPLALAVMSYAIFSACTKAADVLPVDVPLLSGESETAATECAVINLSGENVTGTLEIPTCARITIGDAPEPAPSIDPTATPTATPVTVSTPQPRRQKVDTPTPAPTPTLTAVPQTALPADQCRLVEAPVIEDGTFKAELRVGNTDLRLEGTGPDGVKWLASNRYGLVQGVDYAFDGDRLIIAAAWQDRGEGRYSLQVHGCQVNRAVFAER